MALARFLYSFISYSLDVGCFHKEYDLHVTLSQVALFSHGQVGLKAVPSRFVLSGGPFQNGLLCLGEGLEGFQALPKALGSGISQVPDTLSRGECGQLLPSSGLSVLFLNHLELYH